MAERQFRLPGSTYEELVNIIVAYGTRDEASLRGDGKKLVTRRGRTLAHALARRDEPEIRRNWRAVVATSEFLQNVVSAVKMREGMLYPTLQAYVAHAAGQPRNKPVMAGASAIIEICKAAGLLQEEAGELLATFEGELEPASLAAEADYGAPSDPPKPVETSLTEAATVAQSGGTTINIHLHVRCTPEELEDLAPRLKTLLSEISPAGDAAREDERRQRGRG